MSIYTNKEYNWILSEEKNMTFDYTTNLKSLILKLNFTVGYAYSVHLNIDCLKSTVNIEFLQTKNSFEKRLFAI